MKALQLILLILPVAAILGCQSDVENGEHKKKETTIENQLVEVVQVQSLQPSKKIVLPGELKPWNKVNIYAKVKGFVRTLNVDRGTFVKSGQVLAILDAPEIIAELDQAKGQMLASEGNLLESNARFQASKRGYYRLLQTNNTKGAVSVNELDQAHSKMLADSAIVSIAEGNAKASRSFYNNKSQLVDYLTIRAPFDGTIIERNISPGALVGISDGSSKPLFVLEDNSILRLTVAIPEVFSNGISEKSDVAFSVGAIPEKKFSAKFSRSSRSLIEENRAMMAEFDVINKFNELKAGMYAEVKLPISRSSYTLFVPVKSVVSSSERVFIIRVNEDKAEWVTVKKGNVVDTLVEVFGEIKMGDRIVLKASEELRNGQLIKVKEIR
jgi:RND family efflux transporter MFP subunit